MVPNTQEVLRQLNVLRTINARLGQHAPADKAGYFLGDGLPNQFGSLRSVTLQKTLEYTLSEITMKQTPLSKIPRELIVKSFDDAMADAPFDTTFHEMFKVLNLSWYSSPEDARKMARRNFDTILADYESGTIGNKHEYNCLSGCINVKVHVYGNSMNCEICFDPLTSGYGYVKIN